VSDRQTIFQTIKASGICEKEKVFPDSFDDILVTSATEGNEWRWLIGPYYSLTAVATALRINPDLRAELADREVRFGMRDDDVSWEDDTMGRSLQPRIGPRVERPADDYLSHRVKGTHLPLTTLAPACRQADRFQNVETFWETQTLQSHHIVEYSTLVRVGVSRPEVHNEFHRDLLPCVLLVAELHQLYVTAYLRGNRNQFREGMSADEAGKVLGDVFDEIYFRKGGVFRPLGEISKIINQAACEFLRNKPR
jgi:hypothetical protein